MRNVVRPRVEQFLKNYPDNKTVSEFAVAAENDGWEAVSGWEHKTKLGRIRALVAFLQGQKVETVAGLKEWGEVPGNPDLLLPVKGVGPKTRDYLLMMAGASTPAVDVHLKNFVREAGVTVSDSDYEEAKEIITTASKLYGVTPFQFDQGIWLYMAKKCNPNAEGPFRFCRGPFPRIRESSPFSRYNAFVCLLMEAESERRNMMKTRNLLFAIVAAAFALSGCSGSVTARPRNFGCARSGRKRQATGTCLART